MVEGKLAENVEKLAKFEVYYDDAKPVNIREGMSLVYGTPSETIVW